MKVSSPHFHVWTGSIVGVEYGNAIFESPVDAAEKFARIAVQITAYNDDINVSVTDALFSLQNGNGMRVGNPQFAVLLSRCKAAPCRSPLWN